MPVTHLSGRHARVDVTLDGVTFTRSSSDAARRGVGPVHVVAWESVRGAVVTRTRKGRPVLRVEVVDAAPVARHRDDPHALKARRGAEARARELAERIADEVETRRRWRRHADEIGA